MVYDFQNDRKAPELTLLAARSYIWSLSAQDAKFRCWVTVFTEGKHDEVLDWINSLESTKYINALRACLLIFSVSDGQVVPRKFQLAAGLAAYERKHAIINTGTGSGETLSMVIPLLMDLEAVAIIISPLKRLRVTQAEELERFLLRPLVINEDTDQSLLQNKVSCIVFHLECLPRVSRHHRT